MDPVKILPDRLSLGVAAAEIGADLIRYAIKDGGSAAIVLATGASQFEMLDALIRAPDIDWSRVTAFHLDEYVGLSENHPASFRRYLRERFLSRVPGLAGFVPIAGDAASVDEEVRRLCSLITAQKIHVCFAGIGENCHVAFNDPPADFETDTPFLLVELDAACRAQQAGEGWFASPSDVPSHAISMSIAQILKSEHLVVTVSEKRKAAAVKAAIEGSISPHYPASILRRHPRCTMLLDRDAASALSGSADTAGA
ncbi:MAG: glucosamine-6-phosphate deaminase [Dehalococcoidia bacterium]